MSARYQELNREVKRSCRRDKRVYVESEAERAEEAGRRGDVKTLYKVTRRLRTFARKTSDIDFFIKLLLQLGYELLLSEMQKKLG